MIQTIEQILHDLLAGKIDQAKAKQLIEQHMAYEAEADGLRDHFAALAMQGMLAYPGCEARGSHHNNNTPEGVASMAYNYADSMLEARKK